MLSTPDAQLALEGAQVNELAQRKLQMDALRGRLGDQRDEKAKLREACEGFESVFLQKMWEQMRATVPQEGYLHSKEEKFWQSMFDQELSKKMASAGGVGLGDMLFDQLAVTLLDASRVSTPSKADKSVPVKPLHDDAPSAASQNPLPLASPKPEMPSASELYTPLDEQQAAAQNRPDANSPDTKDGLYDLASAVAAFEVNEAEASEIPASPAVTEALSAPVATESSPVAPVFVPAAPQAAAEPIVPLAAAMPEAALRSGPAPLDEGNHDAIMRRLAEIAYAARAPQAEVAKILTEETVAAPQIADIAEPADTTDAADVTAQFGASRLGNPERVRTPQRRAVPDAPIVHRSANADPMARMQHPSLNKGIALE